MIGVTYQPPPQPFGRGDAGIEAVWDTTRQESLEAVVARAAPPLRASWSDLRHAIGEYAATWERIRGTVLASNEWTFDMQRVAGECLLDARGEFDQILRAIASTAAAPLGDEAEWKLRIHRWLVDLRPPAVCKVPRYAASRVTAHVTDHAAKESWRASYARAYQHFLENRLDDAKVALEEAMHAAAEDDGGARARVHLRLGLVELGLAHMDGARAHFHDALRFTADGSDPYVRLHTLTALMATSDDPVAALSHYADARGLIAHTFANDPAAVHEEAGNLHVRAAWAIGRIAAAKRFDRCPIDCAEISRPTASCSVLPEDRRAHQCVEDLLALASEYPGSTDLQNLVAKTRSEHLLEHGDIAGAELVAQAAVAREDPDRPATWDPMLYDVLGRVQMMGGRLEDAKVSLSRALVAHTVRGQADQAPALLVLHNLCAIAEHSGDATAVRDYGERARVLVEQQQPHRDVAVAVELYARLGYLYLDDPNLRDWARGVERLRRGLEWADGVPLDDAHTSIVHGMREALALATRP